MSRNILPNTLMTWQRIVVGGVALFGLFGVIPVSLADAINSNPCPRIGPVPICHIVLTGYLLVFLNMISSRFWNPTLFLIGWLPVFLFALVGSSLELAGNDTCPKTQGGWPKCYFSLLLACAVFAPLLFSKKSS
ncbi:MAG: hypothetical protein ACR2O3_05250 [Rhizobiaceae bacterium]